MNYFQSKNFPTVRRGTNVDDVLDERAQAAEARLHSVRKVNKFMPFIFACALARGQVTLTDDFSPS